VTAVCKLCGELITGAPILEGFGAERLHAEFGALGEAMRVHLVASHGEHLQSFSALMHSLMLFCCSLFAEGAGEFTAEQAELRAFVVQSVSALELVIERRPAGAPAGTGLSV